MMPEIPTVFFSKSGGLLLNLILSGSVVIAIIGVINTIRRTAWQEKTATMLLFSLVALWLVGYGLICWFHYQLHDIIALRLEPDLAAWLNERLAAMNKTQAYALPLYDPVHPPRYKLPLWIENEKYYFWFLCYGFMALIAHYRAGSSRLRAVIHVFLGLQGLLLYFAADPFAAPLPRFFAEIQPWFAENLNPMTRFGLFMKLYPRMIFYYNAEYMWFHPPMLFLSYAAMTIAFIASVFMLVSREMEVEKLCYDFAKFGYFMLTLGMLLGYPWALQAWGPNWWWDPKICSSIMMWAIYSTYLHTRLYANKPAMWYFSSFLGIACFVAMIFTFATTFFFPGEHTMQ